MSVAPLSAVGITRYNRPETGWTKRRQAFDRDPKHTLRAFRVGSYVLSHADGFVQTQRQIARGCSLSVTTVQAALVDLELARYVIRRRIRESGRWVGTAYAISDVPFTDEELVTLCPPGTDSECSDSESTESVPPKETTPVRETTKPKKINPSGGHTADAVAAVEAESSSEEPMPPAVQPTLDLDIPEPEKPQRKPRPPGANDVVAAFVESYRSNHGGQDPSRRDASRIGRDARELLNSGKAAIEELTAAATGTGATAFAALGVQLNMVREKKAGTGRKTAIVKGYVPAMVNNPAFQESRDEHVAWRESLHHDATAAAKVAADPFWRDRLVQEDPSLEAVFAQVTAA